MQRRTRRRRCAGVKVQIQAAIGRDLDVMGSCFFGQRVEIFPVESDDIEMTFMPILFRSLEVNIPVFFIDADDLGDFPVAVGQLSDEFAFKGVKV